MKINLSKSLLVFAVMFVFAAIHPAKVSAAKLYFEPSTTTSSYSQDFTVKVMIDTEGAQVFGADASIKFPTADMTLKSVSNGNFFTDFSQAQNGSVVEIHGFFSAAFQTKSGKDNFATLVFTPNKSSGSGQTTFNCDGGGNDTFILNSSGNNILSCSSLNTLGINYGGSDDGGSGGTDGTSSTPGPTNSCNGTCGSHYNCNAGLFCSDGFCRNPDCPNDNTCGCQSATPTPRAAARASTPRPTSSVKPTPQLVVLKKYTPAPLNLPTAAPEEEQVATREINLKQLLAWGILIVIAIALLLAILKYLKKHSGKNLPPKGLPPMPPPMMTPPPVDEDKPLSPPNP